MFKTTLQTIIPVASCLLRTRRRDLTRLLASTFLLAIFAGTLPASARTLTLVAFGDSLVAGYGLSPQQSFPAQLEQALKKRGHDVTVVNAGVSGDTTAAGLARFDWAINADADAVLLELGANDALRGHDPKSVRDNLEQILVKLAERGLPVLIAGMRAPANWGQAYVEEFDQTYPALAAAHDALLYPFFLDGVATDRALNQSDGLHPTTEGVAIIVQRIMPYVEKLIARAEKRT